MSSLDSRRRYVPRRALMYVPGSDLRKVEKIPKLGADCVCIDCEDGVSVNMKEQVDCESSYPVVPDFSDKNKPLMSMESPMCIC